jgi:hypothetical protein
MLNLLSHVQKDIPADGDPIALAIVLAVLAAFAVWVIVSKRSKKAAVQEEAPVQEVCAAELPKAPGAAGQLKLYNVEPKTAAMIMAIVADKMGKPLNELRFLSIKEVE